MVPLLLLLALADVSSVKEGCEDRAEGRDDEGIVRLLWRKLAGTESVSFDCLLLVFTLELDPFCAILLNYIK